MKWFYSDLTNKGTKSELVNGLLVKDNTKVPSKITSHNELLTLVYMSYLETNNYLKTETKYLFGELVKSTSKTVY